MTSSIASVNIRIRPLGFLKRKRGIFKLDSGKTPVPRKDEQQEIKHPKPNILLVDMQGGEEDFLRDAGFNAISGSFGLPYQIEQSDAYTPMALDSEMPDNYAEQDIIVIDLLTRGLRDSPRTRKTTSRGTDDWWVRAN